MPLLEVSETGRRIAETFSLENISFSLGKGGRLGIAGATGSGKSTLLKIIAGLDDADSGTIRFESQKVTGPKYRLIPGQPGIAYLSQHYELRNHYRMEELLSYANTLGDEKAERLFELCRISHLLKRTTFQLSGGEKQRIALARLLLTAPRLLIMDEPFSNLDLIHKTLLKTVLDDLGRELGLTCIIASHDPSDLLSWAGTMLILQNGRLVQEGSPQEIYSRPVTEYAGALLGKYNLPDHNLADRLYPQATPLSEGKQVFLRPEQLQLTAAPGAGAGPEVQVHAVAFYGSYYEMQVHTGTQLLRLFASDISFNPGDIAYLRLKPGIPVWTV